MEPLVKGKKDPLVLAPKWRLAREGRYEFYELRYWIWFVAKCLNMIVDPSFMNSVTGSDLVAKCSNILQDNYIKLGCYHEQNETCGLYYKTFRIVIYDRNDSTIVEPVL